MAISKYSTETILLAKRDLETRMEDLYFDGLGNSEEYKKLKKGVDVYVRYLNGNLCDFQLQRTMANI